MTTITLVNGWKEKYQHFNLIPHTQIVRKNPVKTESCMKGYISIETPDEYYQNV